MRPAERKLKVKEFFAKEEEFIDLNELCKRLNASRSSIRRDLIELEQEGLVRRVHGGAISLQVRDEILDFGRLSSSCQEEKVQIGKVAARLIEDGQTVLLGGGSTVVEVARNLFDRPIQVITNSIPVAQIFWDCKRVEVTLTGGYVYPRLGVQLGPICERMLSSIAADVLIMGVRGITEAGISDTNTLIVESIRSMIKAARKVIIVADHSKFGRDAMVHVADLEDIDLVVSDDGLAPEYREMLRKNGVDFLVASDASSAMSSELRSVAQPSARAR
ncbi:MAG TPA: DeoR/GlpR family DNA-binding transcription regulator [Clostridia bacterium]|nr:DeoR/GlpR family DNA-binding transcription regulator [Clostridia bacterium]